MAFFAFLLPLFSALRLAKFNIDSRQSDEFIGLPTPANALMIASIALINQNILSPEIWLVNLTSNSIFLLSITFLLCILQISEIRLLSLKFKNLRWDQNQDRFILIFVSAVLLIWLQISAIPVIIILYIFISLLKKGK